MQTITEDSTYPTARAGHEASVRTNVPVKHHLQLVVVGMQEGCHWVAHTKELVGDVSKNMAVERDGSTHLDAFKHKQHLTPCSCCSSRSRSAGCSSRCRCWCWCWRPRKVFCVGPELAVPESGVLKVCVCKRVFSDAGVLQVGYQIARHCRVVDGDCAGLLQPVGYACRAVVGCVDRLQQILGSAERAMPAAELCKGLAWGVEPEDGGSATVGRAAGPAAGSLVHVVMRGSNQDLGGGAARIVVAVRDGSAGARRPGLAVPGVYVIQCL